MIIDIEKLKNDIDKIDDERVAAIEKTKFDSVSAMTKEYDKRDQEKLYKSEIKNLLDDEIVQKYVGKYKIYDDLLENPNFESVFEFVSELEQDTKDGLIPEGHPLHMKPRHAKNLVNEMSKMYGYSKKVLLKKGSSIEDDYRSNEMQGYLNSRLISKKGEENTESTMLNVKNRIKTINTLQIIAQGKFQDFSSNIKTKGELAYERTKDKVPVQTKKKKEDLFFSNADYKKIANDILEKMRKNPASVGDTDVAILLSGNWGPRLDTILQMNTGNLDIVRGELEIQSEINKSRVDYIAKSFTENKNEILSLIHQRAEIMYGHLVDDFGHVPLTTCSDKNCYNKLNNRLRKYGLDEKYKNVGFHGMRRMFGQNAYDNIRNEIDIHGEVIARRSAKAEVNYLLGHNPAQRKNVNEYIRDAW